MKRSRFALGLVGLSLAGGCKEEPSSAIVVALSSEAPIPDGVRSIKVKVTRGGTTYHDATYYVQKPPAGEPQLTIDDIPGTLSLRDDGKSEGPVSVRIEADVVVEADGSRKVVRSATMPFAADKQRLLRMPIQLSCADPGLSCKDGETCRAGRCVPEAIPEADAEEFVEEKVRPTEGKCFRRDDCETRDVELRIPVETVVSVLRDDCTVPYVFPGLSLGGKVIDAEFAGVTDPASSPALQQKRARVNMGYIWSGAYNVQNVGKDENSGQWTVVDRDQADGWEYADAHPDTKTKLADASMRVLLSQGLCRALKADRDLITPLIAAAKEKAKPEIDAEPDTSKHEALWRKYYTRPATRLLGTVESRGCPSKPRDLPECRANQKGISF